MLPWLVIYLTAAMSMPFINGQMQNNIVSIQNNIVSITKSLDISISTAETADYRDLPKEGATYDFIVVGAGPAGSVLANRLSENPNWNVYLIEAGGVEGIMHSIPLMSPYFPRTQSNWGHMSVPQENACFGMYNKVCSLPRGKLLGGSSSINFMIYTRGNKLDFDRWAENGAPGWSYKEVLPYFLRSERAHLVGLENSKYHNHTGPLSVEFMKFRTQLGHSYVAGAQEAGHASVDYNGESQMGVSYVQSTTLTGKRQSSFKSYIQPIRKERKNLHIITEAHVSKVLIHAENKTAYGVEVIYENKKYNIYASKEVILSAGVFNSPQILMLSGVGPAENLKQVGIPLIKELPVGQTMEDHISHFGPTFLTNTTGQSIFVGKVSLDDGFRFVTGNPDTQVSSIGGVEALTFIKTNTTNDPADFPDIELITLAGGFASDEGQGFIPGANIKQEIYDKVYAPLNEKKQDHFTVVVMQFHPKSTGRVWLNSSDPLDKVVIDPKYFSDPYDLEQILEGIKEAIRISKTPAMQKIGAKLLDTPIPGCEEYKFGTDDYWRCSIRTLSFTVYHQVATCRMGAESDKTTVVNHELKVHGIKNLRVADTSIIPKVPSAHTQAFSYMIGEKGVDMIRAAWADK